VTVGCDRWTPETTPLPTFPVFALPALSSMRTSLVWQQRFRVSTTHRVKTESREENYESRTCHINTGSCSTGSYTTARVAAEGPLRPPVCELPGLLPVGPRDLSAVPMRREDLSAIHAHSSGSAILMQVALRRASGLICLQNFVPPSRKILPCSSPT
jgi:hypothetical protein